MMVLSGLQLLPLVFDFSVSRASNIPGAVFGAVGLLVGYGLIRHIRLAYYAFGIVGVLSTIAFVYSFAPLLFMLMVWGPAIISSPSASLFWKAVVILITLLVLVAPAFYITSGIILYKKSIRRIFLD